MFANAAVEAIVVGIVAGVGVGVGAGVGFLDQSQRRDMALLK